MNQDVLYWKDRALDAEDNAESWREKYEVEREALADALAMKYAIEQELERVKGLLPTGGEL